ncbi:hypothetical protein PFMC_01792 [Plasmodium falciparum CAMP/Malaysia]|uniref:Uncharacterized protein n=1 Tax=Plasmodium falciparum (isolate Camp / Malaysia) TaxID=5835 RepID=A0A024XC11_PLAFC|nr:hypothetical protein PFMC_01792 [Plasmodium falciparum CAMP/Malaysia]
MSRNDKFNYIEEKKLNSQDFSSNTNYKDIEKIDEKNIIMGDYNNTDVLKEMTSEEFKNILNDDTYYKKLFESEGKYDSFNNDKDGLLNFEIDNLNDNKNNDNIGSNKNNEMKKIKIKNNENNNNNNNNKNYYYYDDELDVDADGEINKNNAENINKKEKLPRFSNLSLLNDDFFLKSQNLDMNKQNEDLKNKRDSLLSLKNLRNSSIFNLSLTDENLKRSYQKYELYSNDKLNMSLSQTDQIYDSDLLTPSPSKKDSVKKNPRNDEMHNIIENKYNNDNIYKDNIYNSNHNQKEGNSYKIHIKSDDPDNVLDLNSYNKKNEDRKNKNIEENIEVVNNNNNKKLSIDLLDEELDNLKKKYLLDDSINYNDKNNDYLDEYASDSEFLKRSSLENKMNLDLNYGNDDSLNNSRRISNNSFSYWENKINSTRKIKINNETPKKGILKISNSVSPLKDMNDIMSARKKSVQFSHRSIAVFDDKEKISPLHLTQFTKISSDSNNSEFKKKSVSIDSCIDKKDNDKIVGDNFLEDLDKSPIDKLLYKSNNRINNNNNNDNIMNRSSAQSIRFKAKISVDHIESARLSPIKNDLSFNNNPFNLSFNSSREYDYMNLHNNMLSEEMQSDNHNDDYIIKDNINLLDRQNRNTMDLAILSKVGAESGPTIERLKKADKGEAQVDRKNIVNEENKSGDSNEQDINNDEIVNDEIVNDEMVDDEIVDDKIVNDKIG